MRHQETIEAIIISRRDFGEADRILTAFSLKYGKIFIVAKGARKIKSRMASHIEPFSIGKYTILEGKTNYILTGAEGVCSDITELDLNLFEDATYACELIALVTAEKQPTPELYKEFKAHLKALPKVDGAKRMLLVHEFEFAVLRNIGYTPNYVTCKACTAPLKEVETYSGNFEGVYCENCNGDGFKMDKNTFKLLRMLGKGESIACVSGATNYNEPLKRIVTSYLYDILPKQPKSRIYEK